MGKLSKVSSDYPSPQLQILKALKVNLKSLSTSNLLKVSLVVIRSDKIE